MLYYICFFFQVLSTLSYQNFVEKIMKAYIYARQSSGCEEKSLSIEQQLQNCNDLCKRKGWKVGERFTDHNTSGRTYPTGAESVALQDGGFVRWLSSSSGNKSYRSGLGGLLSKLGRGDVIVVDDITRLCRPATMSNLVNYLGNIFVDLDIVVYSAKGERFDPNRFVDLLIFSISSQMSDNQIKMQSEKSRASQALLRNQGILPTGCKAFGLSSTPNHGMLKIDPEKAEVIRFVMESIAKRHTYASILRELNTNESYRRLVPKCYYESSVNNISDQPLYCGYMRNTEKKLIPCKQMEGQEIISYDLFKRVREIREETKNGARRDKYNWLPFSGLLYCGYCGSRMVVSKDGDRIYYICHAGSNVRFEDQCRHSRVGINNDQKYCLGLKKAVAPLLILAQYYEVMEVADMEERSKARQRKVAELERLNAKQQEIFALFSEEKITRASMANSIAVYEPKIEAAQTEIDEIDAFLLSDCVTKRKEDKYWCEFEKLIADDLDDDVYEHLLKQAISRIDCFKEKVIIHTNGQKIELRRFMHKNRRSFPKYVYDVNDTDAKRKKEVAKCKIEVDYLYDEAEKKIIFDMPIMKIFEMPISKAENIEGIKNN